MNMTKSIAGRIADHLNFPGRDDFDVDDFNSIIAIELNYGKKSVVWRKDKGGTLSDFLNKHSFEDFVHDHDNAGTIWLEDGTSWLETYDCSESCRMYWQSRLYPPLPE